MDARSNGNWTALMIAAYFGQSSVISALVESGDSLFYRTVILYPAL